MEENRGDRIFPPTRALSPVLPGLIAPLGSFGGPLSEKTERESPGEARSRYAAPLPILPGVTVRRFGGRPLSYSGFREGGIFAGGKPRRPDHP
jgi:hypothetical protein